MALNWLYGRPEDRSYVLDLDTVREIATVSREAGPEMTVEFGYVEDYSGRFRVIEDDELGTVSAADRARLTLQGRMANVPPNYAQVGAVDVSFARHIRPSLSVQPLATPASIELESRIRRILKDSGRPRMRWPRRQLALTPIPALVLLVSWLWLQLTAPLPPAAYVFGWVLVAIVAGVTVYQYQRQSQRVETYPGHKIRDYSRSELYAARAERRRDVRVAIITAILSIAATLIVTWVIAVAAHPGK